jgi:hypothetical protein
MRRTFAPCALALFLALVPLAGAVEPNGKWMGWYFKKFNPEGGACS